MDAEKITLIAIIVIAAFCAIIAGIQYLKKIKGLSKEEKIALLKEFVCGAVVKAEAEIGAGHGDEKLQQVEQYFLEKAPTYYKMILSALGKDNLKEIIVMALNEIKANFEKNKE